MIAIIFVKIKDCKDYNNYKNDCNNDMMKFNVSYMMMSDK